MSHATSGRIQSPVPRWRSRARLLIAFLCALAAAPLTAQDRPYVFAWPFIEQDMAPRGGTTRGPEVSVLREESTAFQRLQEPGLSRQERDRRAILAMAGSHRVSFDFMELVGFSADFTPAQPYMSWGTEHIYVVEDSPGKVSLQHVLVMSVLGEEGEVMGPFVTKHWRQDWQFEAASAHVYRGRGTWERVQPNDSERTGSWLQTVWDVHDAPRYAAWGRWEHTAERSRWVSDKTWRPLPRREFSVRDDYDVLIGTNTHIILPAGWVQEEHNLKTVLADAGEVQGRLAREIGIARYEQLVDFDRSAGDAYWQQTAPFWALVRAYWEEAMAESERIHLRSELDGRKLFEPLFARAQEIMGGAGYSSAENREFIHTTIDAYRLQQPEVSGGAY